MKKQYIKPTLNSVEFKVEEGYAASGFITSVADGISMMFDFDEVQDINNDSRFTRPTDRGGNVWNGDGTNSGYWD